MKIYKIQSKQNLPISISEAWNFLSNPKNLKVITPPHMEFKISIDDERSIYAGQIIEYTVKPILGIALTWVTEITHVVDQVYFVDEQRYGPYSFWHHKHFIKEIEGGIEMEDIIHYKLPLGIIGQMIHPFLVKPELEKIFSYRRNKLIALFGIFK